MKTSKFTYRIFSLCFCCAILLVTAFGFSCFVVSEMVGRLSELQFSWFSKSFYSFLVLDTICLIGVFLFKQNGARTILLCLSCIFPLLIQYLLPGSFPILLLVWSGTMLAAGTLIHGPPQILSVLWVMGILMIGYILPMPESFVTPDPGILPHLEFYTMTILILLIGILTVTAQQSLLKFKNSQEKLIHEAQTNKQLSSFNTKLQSYAKKTKQESASLERNRITREMHDANGYAFTNIMALMNAAISSGNQEWTVIEDILQMTWKQAYQGLQESRKTLRTLRKTLENAPEPSIFQTTKEIAHIFSECTGIEVEVHWGNLEQSYGPQINRILNRIIQESLVNSVRHGRATEVIIYFWERKQTLFLSIEDNGHGNAHVVKGIGLTGMEERVAPYDGKVEFSSSFDDGFKLMITLPLPQEGRKEQEETEDESVDQSTGGR